MIDISHLRNWIGKSETKHEVITPFPSNALAATLDRDDVEYGDGSALPPLWHWMHFLPIYKLQDTGYDGHAALGNFLPPVPLPRRMWAGSRLSFHTPMLIGKKLRKTSTVLNIEHKKGRSGELIFVTIRHQLFDGDTLGIDEEHDIVYREPISNTTLQPLPPEAPENSQFHREINPSSVLLFRYSALTFNGHRIHYDHPFCTQAEGYKGLVVHGPLLATLLLDLLRREHPKAWVQSFEFRALGTIFDTDTFSVHGRQENGSGFELWARRPDGTLGMKAKATIRPE